MSKKIEKKVQQTFIDSITIKQKILDEGAHEILIEAGKHIVKSITGGVSSSFAVMGVLQLMLNT